MEWSNWIAELTGYAAMAVAVLGVCGCTAAWVNDLIRRSRQDPYPEYGWSREMPRHSSMWDQLQAAPPETAPEVAAPVLAVDDTPEERRDPDHRP